MTTVFEELFLRNTDESRLYDKTITVVINFLNVFNGILET